MLPAWASHIYLNIVTDADIAIQVRQHHPCDMPICALMRPSTLPVV